jgi:spermidine synthase
MSKKRGAKEKKAPAQSAPSEVVEEQARPAAPTTTLRRSEYLYANLAALLSGGCLMVMELVASRVLAPSFGNTVFLWTSVIGLILAALSAGYYLGGVAADRAPRIATLAWALALSGLFVGVVPLLSPPILSAFGGPEAGAMTGPLIATGFLFLVPGVLIGACSPIAVKLVALGGADVGHASGRVSALGALGSIAGTFSAGFFLIPLAGNQALLVGIAIVLALLGVAGFALGKIPFGKPALVLLVTVGLCAWAATTEAEPEPGTLFDQQTFYHRVNVRDVEWGDDRVRILSLDTTGEGAMFLDDPDGLPFEYTHYIDVADLFVNEPRRGAFIGGGSFAMPKRFVAKHDGARAVVFELDPVVIDAGNRYFHLDDYPAVTARAGDARQNLRRTDERFDLIFGDAYNGVRAIPSHLATLEYYELVREHLTVGGVYMANIISPLAGDGAAFFRSTARTLLEVFPELYVFAEGDRTESHNLILVCPSSPLELTADEIRELGRRARLEHLTYAAVDLAPLMDAIERAPLLTDDHNPVEVLVADQ